MNALEHLARQEIDIPAWLALAGVVALVAVLGALLTRAVRRRGEDE